MPGTKLLDNYFCSSYFANCVSDLDSDPASSGTKNKTAGPLSMEVFVFEETKFWIICDQKIWICEFFWLYTIGLRHRQLRSKKKKKKQKQKLIHGLSQQECTCEQATIHKSSYQRRGCICIMWSPHSWVASRFSIEVGGTFEQRIGGSGFVHDNDNGLDNDGSVTDWSFAR